MSGILRLESLTKGNTLKQGDKTPLKYRLFDADGENLNIAGKSAVARLMYPDFLRAGYESETLTVSPDNTVTFSIDKVIKPVLYYVEITVDDKYIFPSRVDESKINIDKSSKGSDAAIIEIIGKDILIRDVREQVETEIKPVVDDMIIANQKVLENEKIVQDVNSLAQQLENRQNQVEQFNNQVITEMTDKDVISAPEILGARGSFDTLGERLDDTTAQLAQKANIVQYSQLKSITELVEALTIEGTSVDIDEDITLNEPIILNNSGIWSSNKSTISLGDDGQIIVSGRTHVKDLNIVNISADSTKPMMYLNREGGSSIGRSLFRGLHMDGNNLKRNGIEIISNKGADGIYGVTFEDINFARMNDEIHIEVNKTGDDYGWINGNLFTNIRGGGSYRGIVSIPIDSYARSRNTSNIFTNMQLQTYRTSAVYDLGLNIHDIQPYDFHLEAHKGVEWNKFGKINGEIHSLSQNTVAIFNPKHSMFNASSFFEIGMFTQLTHQNSFVNIHFYTHEGNYRGKITLSLLDTHATNNQQPIVIQYENAKLKQLTVLTQYDSTNDGIRVFIKSFGDVAYWGVYERKYFMPTYSPIRFTPEEMDTLTTQIPSQDLGGFENSTGIYESVVEGGQNITRYNDGRQVIFSDTVERLTLPPIQPDGMSGSTDIQIEFKRRFINKPVVTFNGKVSDASSNVTNIPITNQLVETIYARGVVINTYSQPIDKIIDFSWMAVGRWK